jgi:hypothetical protein
LFPAPFEVPLAQSSSFRLTLEHIGRND